MLKAEAAAWLAAHPTDKWRLRVSMHLNAHGHVEDDAERWFCRPHHRVSAADIWRWRAACEALRDELRGR